MERVFIMIITSVKELLGDELAAQVEAALKGKGKDGTDVDLVAGNDGSYIPAETHTAVKGQAEAAEKALKEAANILKDLGASGDTKNLAADVLKVKGDLSTIQSTHAAEMAKLMKTTALKLGLGGNVHDPDDIISRLNLDEVEIDENGGLKSDLDALVKPIKDSKPYLFKEAPKQELNLRGAVPGQVGGGSSGDGDANVLAINEAFGLKGE
jgi:hypothetical protein